MLCCCAVLPDLRFPIVTALLYAYSLVFLPAFYELWTVTGSGNANFFFASTLVFALAGTSGLLDALWAKGQVVYETERALLLPPAPLSQEEGEDSALPGGEKHVVGTGWIRTTVQV